MAQDQVVLSFSNAVKDLVTDMEVKENSPTWLIADALLFYAAMESARRGWGVGETQMRFAQHMHAPSAVRSFRRTVDVSLTGPQAQFKFDRLMKRLYKLITYFKTWIPDAVITDELIIAAASESARLGWDVGQTQAKFAQHMQSWRQSPYQFPQYS